MQKEELNIQQIIHTIYRRKSILLIVLGSFFIIAFFYSILSKPVYESYVVAKKDEVDDRRVRDEIAEMFQMQTMDELETVIEVIKTRDVLEGVINELKLTLSIDQVEYGNGDSREFDTDHLLYLTDAERSNGKLPRFNKVAIDNSFEGDEFCIERTPSSEFKMYNSESDLPLQTIKISPKTEFVLPGVHLVFDWRNAQAGDKIYFEIRNMEEVVDKLQKVISISSIGATNLAKLTVESTSPQMAMILANTIVENYRKVRLEQKRQTIHYSFRFVNDQLNDIEEKLQDVERELSQFKSENQIVILEESSKDIIEFLSNLESEKLKVELELVESRNKLAEMKKELQNKGYFDQTYITPQRNDRRDSPFSVLLEQLSDAELKRIELLQKRKENHPEVVAVNEQINQIKAKLEEYNQNTLTSYSIIINTLEKKRLNLNNLIQKYSERIENLPEQESELIRLIRNKNVYEKMFTLLLDKREEFRLAELSKLQDIVIVESARVPLKPVRPRKMLNMAISLVLGLFVGFVAIFTLEVFEKKITTLDEIEGKYRFPILTIIQKYDKALEEKMNNAIHGTDRLDILIDDIIIPQESFRLLDLKLQNYAENGAKSFLISSCEENTGKTSIAISFAISLALKGKKVLLVDCDLRKEGIAKFMNEKSRSRGIINLVTENTNSNNIIKQLQLGEKSGNRIDYIPAGGSTINSGKILESEKMKELIDDLYLKYDYIILDTPPVTRVVDTLVLGKLVNDLILVIRPNHTLKDRLELAVEELNDSEINILGFVVNAADITKLSHKYKYGYGYGYEYSA